LLFQIYVDNEKFLGSKRLEGKRAQTAHKPKQVENRFDSGSFLPKQYNDTYSPPNRTINFSRKNSYERLFDRPKPKTDIRVIGKNINEFVARYEKNHPSNNSVLKTTKEAQVGIRRSQDIPNSNRIELVIDDQSIKKEQSNETYPTVVTESVRKSQVETLKNK
jgi:hypothetical protein